MIIRVFLDRSRNQFYDAAVLPETTCNDVILSIIEDESRSSYFVLTELCMGYERVIDSNEQPVKILQQWGNHADKVQFFLRHKKSTVSTEGQRKVSYEETTGITQAEAIPPNILFGTEYCLNKLVEMAGKQKEKLLEQQQMLSDKAQLVSALHKKQQRHKELAADRNVRLDKMRECINEKEAKLKRLRSLKNLVHDQTQKNAEQVKEIEVMKCRFEKKEQELASVIEKMEILTKQLKESHKERSSHSVTDDANVSSAKKEILKEQIMKHNHQNSQNTQQLQWKREILVFRQQQVAGFIEKVNKYQTRLNSTRQKMKQMINKNPQIYNNTAMSKGEETSGLMVGLSTMKHDTKCKTLPHNLKFSDVKLFNRILEASCKSKISDANCTVDSKGNSSENFPDGNFSQIGKRFNDLDTSEFPVEASIQGTNATNSGVKYEKGKFPVASISPERTCVSTSVSVSHISSASSKVVSPAVSANRHSSHLLMNHFAPRPYESKYSFAKFVSYPTILPSSGKGTVSSVGLPGMTEIKDDSKEIIISAPPHKVLPSPMPTSYVSHIMQISPIAPIHQESENKSDFPTVIRSSNNKLCNVNATDFVSDKMEMPDDMKMKTTQWDATEKQFLLQSGKHLTTSYEQSKHKSFDEAALKSSSILAETKRAQTDGSEQKLKSSVADSIQKSDISNPLHGGPTASILHIVNANSGDKSTSRTTLSAPDAFTSVHHQTLEPFNSLSSQTATTSQDGALFDSCPVRFPWNSKITSAKEGSHAGFCRKTTSEFPSDLTHLKSDIQTSSESRSTTGFDVMGSAPNYNKPSAGKYDTSRMDCLTSLGFSHPIYAKSLFDKQLDKGISTDVSLLKLEDASLGEKCEGDKQADEAMLSGQRDEEKSVHSLKMVESSGSSQEKLEAAGNTSEGEIIHNSSFVASSNFQAGVSSKSRLGEKSALESVPVGGRDTCSGLDLEKFMHKPFVPRPVRRRMSSGDMSEDHLNNRVFHQNHTMIFKKSEDFLQPDCVGDEAINAAVKTHFLSGIDSYMTDSNSVEKRNSWLTQPFRRQGNLKRAGKPKLVRRVSFEPLALLLDASLEGELDLVEKTALEVPDVSASNDEGITALHNAICAGHFDIVKFLVKFGCDVNSPDSDGWTPLHCAASCNNLEMTQFLVEHGACIFATTFSDQEFASDKCEEDEEGYDTCCQYLRGMQDKMGFINDAVIYAVFDYEAENPDELSFRSGDRIHVLRKGDTCEQEWWWCRHRNNEGYVPRNLVGLFPRVVPHTHQDPL